MSMASKFGSKLANIFSNDKKSNSAVAQATTASAELEAQQERARKEVVLKLTRTSRLGFPHKPTCIAYDSVQHLIAIGTKFGYVKIYGGESIEYTIYHASGSPASSSGPSSSSSSAGLHQSFGSVGSLNIQANTSNQQSQQQPASAGSPSSSASNNYSTNSLLSSSLSASSSSSLFPAVLFMAFVINEGALITYCEDSTISFWNLRQKQPGILFSRKLVNERASAMHLPFQSNWLYIGTEKGNTYLLNIYNNFSQSGYDIKWNNVIELSQKTKPGKVVHLSDNPLDSSKILIGFDSGLIVLWNLKIKRGELRFYGTSETMSSISWFYDGKQFMSSHNNGSLIVWGTKGDTKPVNILHPHKIKTKVNENDLIPRYNMIKKVSWEANKNGEPLVIFSDGLPTNDCAMKDAITIIKNNKVKTIIEMKDKIIDFLVLNTCPWASADCPNDPAAVVVLLENNIVVIDLKTEGFPQFQHHHPINIHESPVTAIQYIVDPSKSFFQNLISSKEKHLQNQHNLQSQQHQNTVFIGNSTTASTSFYSPLPYPVNGGLKCSKANIFPYNELIVTGHEDGSVRLWDTNGLGLSLLHKFKTHKIFDKRKNDSNSSPSTPDVDMPFKITQISLNSNCLAVAAAGGHVTLYKFYSKNYNPADEELANIPLLEIPISYEYINHDSKSQSEINSSGTLQCNDTVNKKELKCTLRTKIGFRRQHGFQPELVCLLFWNHRPPVVNAIKIYPKNNLLLFGTEESIICADFANKNLLINVSVNDFYGTQDPSHRGQRSPKKNNKNSSTDMDDQSGLNESHNTPHFLIKQLTIDNSSVHRDPSMRENISRSSSYSSLENLSTSEGVCCIAINDYAPAIISNLKNEFQQQISQIWLGTTYGSVVVLNSISFTNNSSGSLNDSSSKLQNNQNLKAPILTPTGTIHSLKGQILDISFLDINGNLLSNVQHGSSSSDRNKKDSVFDNEDDLNNLDMDFSFLATNTISNSIADNFYGSSSTSSAPSTNSNGPTNDSNSTGGGTNSSSSPTTTPTLNNTSTFVNPFSNPPLSHTSQHFYSIDDSKIPAKPSKKALSATKSAKPDYTTTIDSPDKNQFVVITSETQIKVIGLPSHSCIHNYTVTEGIIGKASVVVINSLSYLSCYLTNGCFLIFNLPNPTLKTFLNLNSQSAIAREKELMDRACRTFCFANKGHALFMFSPSEIQKVYLSTTLGASCLTEMLSEFFDPKVVTPPPPKPNLFKSLFSSTPFDREELFGESSGKPSTSIIKNIEGDVQKTRKELTELQKLALERGEKLNALQLKTEEMTMAASQFAKNAHDLANKYKNKGFFK